MKSVTATAIAIAVSLATGPTQASEVDIDFVHPVQKDEKTRSGKGKPDFEEILPTMSFSGWPLTIELTMNDEEGIASNQGNLEPFFPSGQTGFVVFSDPDGCLNMDSGEWVGPVACEIDGELVLTSELPSDETYVEFTSDVDMQGAADFQGNFAVSDLHTGRQEITTNYMTKQIGPRTAAFEEVVDTNGNTSIVEIRDGFGNGADDDLTSLVLVARHGSGIAYQTNGIAKSPLELINLAGHAHAVTYELNNAKGKTSVNSHFLMSGYIVAPVVIADDCVGPADGSDCRIQWRIDGATDLVYADELVTDPIATPNAYPELVGTYVYEMSAMAVSGAAPSSVVDMNGDDAIDESDLELMGYDVIGDKESVRFKLFPGQRCFGGSGENTVFEDHDNNGIAEFGEVCPAGAGSLSKVPR